MTGTDAGKHAAKGVPGNRGPPPGADRAGHEPPAGRLGALAQPTAHEREREARERASRLAALVDSSSDAIVGLDAGGRVDSWNSGAEQVFGKPASECLGQSLPDVVGPGCRDVASGLVDKVRRGERVSEERVRCPDGQGGVRHVLVSVSPLAGNVRRRAGALLVARDVTASVEAERELRELNLALANAMPGIARLDAEGRYVHVNEAFASTCGCEPAELLAGSWHPTFHPEDRAMVREALERMRREGRAEFEARGLRKDGGVFFAHVLAVRQGDEEGQGHHCLMRDISAQRRAELKQHEEADRHVRALRAAGQALWDWDPGTGLVYLSRHWWSMIGEEKRGRVVELAEWLRRVHPEDRQQLESALENLRLGRLARLDDEHRLQHASSRWCWVSCRGSVESDHGGRQRLSGSFTEISARRAAHARLLHAASHDPLTQLPNRTALMAELDRCARQHRRNADLAFGLLYLDLDGFKLINDTWGHEAGDRLLRTLAGRLRACVSESDQVARIGGDEFVVLLREVADPGELLRMAERVRSAIRRPFDLGGMQAYVSCSIGSAIGEPGQGGANELLRQADEAMYRAKRPGARRAGSPELVPERDAAAQRLREAFEKGELRLQYQPIVCLRTGGIAGVEALVRWRDPPRGLVPPRELFSLADQVGLAFDVERWVLAEASRRVLRWHGTVPGRADLELHVNLSFGHLSTPGLLEDLESVLADSGLPPTALTLELDEAVIEDRAHVWELLPEIVSRGVDLEINDFGSGFSPLRIMRRLPFRGLKIERSFLGELDGEAPDATMVATLAAVAHSLSMRLSASGVESLQQLQTLRRLGCSRAQGHLFALPLGVDDAELLLRSWDASTAGAAWRSVVDSGAAPRSAAAAADA